MRASAPGVTAMAITLLVSASVLGGCGSEHHTAQLKTARQSGENADLAQKKEFDRIPAADRLAFFRLASASGALRISTAAVAVGKARQLGNRARLSNARRQVVALAPSDRGLRGLRRRLAAALAAAGRAARTNRGVRTAARAGIAATDAVNSGLTRYSRKHPALGAGIPD